MKKRMLAALMGAMAFCGSVSAAQIPSHAVEDRGHYYAVFDVGCRTWDEAEAYCERMGGHLATIGDARENNAAFDAMRRQGFKDAYFGLTDREREGTWRWVTGEPVTFVNWSRGEPNNERGKEHYAMFYHKSPSGTWNDGDFGRGTVRGGTAFVCEWEAGGSQKAQGENALELLLGTYEGSYVASQGETGLTLTVFEDGGQYWALFDFYNLPGRRNARSGKYLMTVRYDAISQMYHLDGREWLERPGNYIFCNLKGFLQDGVFSGSRDYPFRVSRVR